MGMPTQTPPPYPPSRAQWKAQRAQWKMQARMQRDAYRAQTRSLSRGSLVGPLLLIAIGVVALLLTMHRIDAGAFWHWYAQWWPLVLIGAGVVLALESLAFSGHSRVRLGGWAVLLAIVLACLGAAADSASPNWSQIGDQLQIDNNGVNLPEIFGQKHEVSEQIVHALPDHATLIIQNPHGNVTVAEANDNQMHLTLDKTVYTGTDTQAKRMMQDVEPLITTSESVVTVHMPSSATLRADMTLSLPADAVLQVQARRGDVVVNGRQAPVEINADHGDVKLSGITGAAQATMHQGNFSADDIHGGLKLDGRMDDVTLSQIAGAVSMDGDFFGDVDLKDLRDGFHFHSSRTDIQAARLAGSLSLDGDDLTIENVAGPVSVSTDAKTIAVRQVTGEVRVRNANGDVEVGADKPIGPMNIDNRNGSVQLKLPEDARFSVDATATDGQIESDFPLSTKNSDGRGTASGAVGGGGPVMHIVVEKGDITLRKK